MIITCLCGKKFNVDASLIPSEGRLLKCGLCGRKWHYKSENFNKDDIDKKKQVKIKKINPLENIPNDVDKIITDAENVKSEDTVAIYKNGSIVKMNAWNFNSNDIYYAHLQITHFIDLAASDYIEAYVRISDASGSPVVDGSAVDLSEFSGYRLIGA